MQYDNDKDRMVNWGMVGGGAGGIAGSLLNARNLGATGTAVATGAFAAVAAAGVSKNRQLDGEPDTLKHDVALAAAAGAAGGWGLGKVAKSLTTRIRVPEGMDVGVTRRQFWLKWIW